MLGLPTTSSKEASYDIVYVCSQRVMRQLLCVSLLHIKKVSHKSASSTLLDLESRVHTRMQATE